MRILLVEDDLEIGSVFEAEFIDGGFELFLAHSRDEALNHLGSARFDVVVCDLRIPSSADALDEDVTHGLAVLAQLLNEHSGTPTIAFSAYGTVEIMQDLLKSARQEDFLGEGSVREMLSFFSKDQLPDCLQALHDMAESIVALDSIEIATGMVNLDLSWEHERVLRVYARRLGATVIRASALAGGLSGSRVLRLRLEASGAHVASVVAKLADIRWVVDEQQRVELLVAPTLASGSYPSAVTLVRAGAGTCGGLFYSFAGGYERSLYELVNAPNAPELVGAIRGQLAPWRDGAPVADMTIHDIRDLLVTLDDLPPELLGPLAQDENRSISTRRSTAHCDLHVFNVLVSDTNDPMVIDFGAVTQAPAALDPLTLELSIVFHPDAAAICDGWPSASQAQAWDDLGQYVEGCPAPGFVEACREWAFGVAAGDLEVFASLYAYAARQLKYQNTRHEIATALLDCALRRLNLQSRDD